MAALVVGFPFDTGEFLRSPSEDPGLMYRDSQSTLSGSGECREVYFDVECFQTNCARGADTWPIQRDSRPHGTCKFVGYTHLCTHRLWNVGGLRITQRNCICNLWLIDEGATEP